MFRVPEETYIESMEAAKTETVPIVRPARDDYHQVPSGARPAQDRIPTLCRSLDADAAEENLFDLAGGHPMAGDFS